VFGLAIVVFLTLAPGGLGRFNLRWLDSLQAPKAKGPRPPAKSEGLKRDELERV
jgi:hypothetical protein